MSSEQTEVYYSIQLKNKALSDEEGEAMFFGTWMSLIPPVVAILLALITKEV